MDLLCITTGGTIDGFELESGRASSVSSLWTHLHQHIHNFKRADHAALCAKDSREITDADRDQLAQVISQSAQSHFLIGHGTYTICETGRYLKSVFKDKGKIILLVGSWIPYGEDNSDAPMQIDNALGFLRKTDPGVYIAMDGFLWDPDVTEKIRLADGGWSLRHIAEWVSEEQPV